MGGIILNGSRTCAGLVQSNVSERYDDFMILEGPCDNSTPMQVLQSPQRSHGMIKLPKHQQAVNAGQ